MSRLEGIFSPSILGMPAAVVSALPAATKEHLSRILHRQLTRGETLALCALLVLPPTIHFLRRTTYEYAGKSPETHKQIGSQKRETYDPKDTDPPLLKKYSTIKSYTTSRFTYPGVRVFYRPHSQADQLPTSPAPLPLLVFIHGLGGSVAQFHPLLTSFTNVSSCLAIDLPGCGASDFAPTSWDAYTTDALVELLELVIDDHRESDSSQAVVLVGHSMGSSLALRLASPATPHSTDLVEYVSGLVAICPMSGPPTEKQVATFRKLLWIPGLVFDMWRSWDRRGGTESPSVRRFVGADADPEAKRLQFLYNNQSRTPVWRRMASGCLPTYENGVPEGGIPGKDIWSTIEVPVYLIGGADDNATPADEVRKIAECLNLGIFASKSGSRKKTFVDSPIPDDSDMRLSDYGVRSIRDIQDEDFTKDRRHKNAEEVYEDPTTPTSESPTPIGLPPLPRHPKMAVESVILPSPAGHALLYTPPTARILAGLITDFLATHISGRLSPSWQLKYFSQEGKWDVKNLAKWKLVPPVSAPIAGVFRAMKTLREVDEIHNPTTFAQSFGGTVKDVIDISHDTPVYNPEGLEEEGVLYHKLPTVSKIPPTDTDVDAFVALVDKVRADQAKRAKEEGWGDDYVVGVHCHYGFNRTGYFIVCYVVERCGYTLQDAIDTFAEARPNGIRHPHFLDQLFLRYSRIDVGRNGGREPTVRGGTA